MCSRAWHDCILPGAFPWVRSAVHICPSDCEGIRVTTSLSTQSVVVASKDQISSDLNGEAVILDLKSGVYHGLDPIGAVIWKMIQQPRAITDVRDAILAEYD